MVLSVAIVLIVVVVIAVPHIHPFVPRICIPSYPGYASLRTPDIHPLVPRTLIPRIFTPSYPGYSSPRTPDIHPLVPRILIVSHTPGISTPPNVRTSHCYKQRCCNLSIQALIKVELVFSSSTQFF